MVVKTGIISIMFSCTLKNCVAEIVSWVCVGTVLDHNSPGKVPGKHRLKLKLMEFCRCLSWRHVSNSGVKEALSPPPSVMLHTLTACLVYPVPITNIAAQTSLPESSLIVIPSERSLQPGCSALLAAHCECSSTCAQPCELAGTHYTTLHSSHCLPLRWQIDFKLALLDFKSLNNTGSGYDCSPPLWALS